MSNSFMPGKRVRATQNFFAISDLYAVSVPEGEEGTVQEMHHKADMHDLSIDVVFDNGIVETRVEPEAVELLK